MRLTGIREPFPFSMIVTRTVGLVVRCFDGERNSRSFVDGAGLGQDGDGVWEAVSSQWICKFAPAGVGSLCQPEKVRRAARDDKRR